MADDVPAPLAPLEPLAALQRVVYLLDRALAPTYKVRAYVKAAEVVAGLDPDEVRSRARAGTLTELANVGPSTGAVIAQAALGEVPDELRRLEATTPIPLSERAAPYRAALRGDCHLHSNWSDGGAPIEAMAAAARRLGHEYMVLTDHSPRLTVAHGLNRDRLLAQLDEVARLNEQLAPFRILTGMEVDILADGSLDLDDDLLARLDVVVASVHSKLGMERDAMTRRLAVAMANPHTDILGHCSGRKLAVDAAPGTGDAPPFGSPTELKRKPADFDAELVFAACQRFDKAVEINCRPERQDPPDELLALAVEWGCKVAIDTDAHAPGQLEWQPYGCDKAAGAGVPIEHVVNTWVADDLLAWAAAHAA